MKVIAFAVMLFVLAAPTSGRASSITYSTSFGIQDFFFGEVAGVFSASISAAALAELPRFNGSGTLQGVEVFFTSTYTVAVSGAAHDESPSGTFIPIPPFIVNGHNDTSLSTTVDGTLRATLFDPGISTQALNLAQVDAGCTESTSYQGVSCSFSEQQQGTYSGSLALALLPLFSFTGTDPLNLTFSLTGSVAGVCDFDDGGDECRLGVVFFQTGILWGGTASVRYTFIDDDEGDGGVPPTPVPEPASFLLIGSGVLGLIARAQRRTKHARRVRQRASQGFDRLSGVRRGRILAR